MPDLQRILEDRFRAAVITALGPEHGPVDPLVRPAANLTFGDYQANLAMSLAKALKRQPREVADDIVRHLDWQDLCAEAPGVAGPGFINVRLSSAFLERQLSAVVGDPRLGVPPDAAPRTVVVDYSSPNVAKEMHVGHLRSTILGDCLSRVLEFQGHRVIRQNHLGDWGTQFGMLIEHLFDLGWRDSGDHTIADLNVLYQQAKQRFDAEPAFAERARGRVVALQGGDAPTLALWRALIDESKHHFNAIYHRLGVKLTDADLCAESFYNSRLADVAAELEKLGLARVSEGALCVFPPGFKGPDGRDVPLIVRKSDGGFLYATTDLAALRYRQAELGAQRIVYVTDARQKQHFAMLFKTAELAGWTGGEQGGHAVPQDPHPSPLPKKGEGTGIRLDHVPFGTILGEDGKPFKTRRGEVVRLSDLLDEAERRAEDIIKEKAPDLPLDQRRAIAHAVGIGAVKYGDLCNDRIKDYVFSWERMMSFDGNTAPYLQNAYVRIRSIFRKAAEQGIGVHAFDAQAPNAQALQGLGPARPVRLAAPAERALALKLLQLPAIIESVADSLEPHRLCGYLYELAAGYHQFYETCPVLSAPDAATRDSRLALCDVTARTLRCGLDLLGLEVVERM